MPKREQINSIAVATLLKSAFLGFLCGEAYFLSQVLATPFVQWSKEITGVYCVLILLLVGATVAIYLLMRGYLHDVARIARSRRLDLLLALVLGASISTVFCGVGTKWYLKLLCILTPAQIAVLTLAPLFLMVVLLLSRLLSCMPNFTEIRYQWNRLSARCHNLDPPSRESQTRAQFLISDAEKSDPDEDLLGYADRAKDFAKIVNNAGSAESFVFAIDAPWGMGKTTFLRFSTKFIAENYKDFIVYDFNPLRYIDRSRLLEKLLDGLVDKLQRELYFPELRPVFAEYAKMLRGKLKLTVPGIEWEYQPTTGDLDNAFQTLEDVLSKLERRVLIIIDDLDRLPYSDIQAILFALKKSFILPHISYVLCLDTENIAAMEESAGGIDKVSEFLEKFINLKVGLFYNSNAIKKIATESIEVLLRGNSGADPMLVKKALGGLIDILNGSSFHSYVPFIGDIRKLKRFLNILIHLGLETTDFRNSDFSQKDLTNLLLLYITNPNIFRKIYHTETGGREGFFSLLTRFENGRSVIYENSEEYTKYTKGLTENPQFLLNELFSAKRFKSPTEEELHTLACFNGDWRGGRNLEAYLNLIVNLVKPLPATQYRFYRELKDEIKSGRKISDVLACEPFHSETQEDETHIRLWKSVINSASEFSPDSISSLIRETLELLPTYSLIHHDVTVAVRDDLHYYLVALLDTGGWRDSNNSHHDNTNENVRQIAEFIYGEGSHVGKGILQSLVEPARGVLGLYDLIRFRLLCCADRGGDIFNLSRSLAQHADPGAPTVGSVSLIVIAEMREFSQKIFGIFIQSYIQQRKNLFAEVNDLTVKELGGARATRLSNVTDEPARRKLEDELEKTRSRILVFLCYQLGTAQHGHGIGCGYYDEDGNDDKHGISLAFSRYLLDVCFEPSVDKNFGYFADYLLMNFSEILARSDNTATKPRMEAFLAVFDRAELQKYWLRNREHIKSLGLPLKDKIVKLGDRSIPYSRLQQVFDLFDEEFREEPNLGEEDIAEAADSNGETGGTSTTDRTEGTDA